MLKVKFCGPLKCVLVGLSCLMGSVASFAEGASTEVGEIEVGRFRYKLFQGSFPFEQVTYYAQLDNTIASNNAENPVDTIPDFVVFNGIEYKVLTVTERINDYANDMMLNTVLNRFATEVPTWNMTNVGWFTISGRLDFTRCGGVNEIRDNEYVKEVVHQDHYQINQAYYESCPNLGRVVVPPTYDSFYMENCPMVSDLTISTMTARVNPDLLYPWRVSCAALVPPVMVDVYGEELVDYDWDSFAEEKRARELHVPAGTREAYANAEGWKYYGNIIDDLDRRGNFVESYFERDGLIYTLERTDEEGGFAKLIAPADINLTSLCVPYSVTGPDGVEYQVLEIGDCAFLGCNDLHVNNYSFEWGLKRIGDLAFARLQRGGDSSNTTGCTFEDAVALPSSIERVGELAFANCPVEGKLPSSLKYAGRLAFYNAIATLPLYLPEGLEYIGDECFAGNGGCNVVVPSSVSHLGVSALSLQDETYYGRIYEPEFRPGSLRYISKWNATANNQSVEIPDGVETIGTDAMVQGSRVTLGKDVKSINPYAIDAPDVYCLATVPPAVTPVSIINGHYGDKPKIHVRPDCLARYLAHPAWSVYDITDDIDEEVMVEDGVWTYAVTPAQRKATVVNCRIDATADGRIVIPESMVYNGETFPVTKIGKWAFEYVPGIDKYEIPASVTEIDDYAFHGFKKSFDDFGDAWTWVCKSTTPPTVHCNAAFGWYDRMYRSFSDGENVTKIKLKVPEESVDAYRKDKVWSWNFNVVEDTGSGVEAIDVDKTGLDLTQPVAIYRVDGTKAYEGIYDPTRLGNGLYIMVQGSLSVKIPVQ